MVSRRRFVQLGVGLVGAVVAAACNASQDTENGRGIDPGELASPGPDASATLIRGATVFDGHELVGVRDVLVRGEVIVEVGESLDAPGGATVVDASGHTLLPGLIDAHTHTYEVRWLNQSVLFGVTTVLDMFTDPNHARLVREPEPGRAALFSSGLAATTPEGHGTQFGIAVPTLTSPGEADGWVADRVEEGSDYIKIMLEEWGDGPLDADTVAAVAEAAADRGLLSVAHAMFRPLARTAIEAGVDGLAHTVVDEPIDEETLSLAEERGVFVISTLSVLRGAGSPASVLDDPRLTDWLPTLERRHLEERVAQPAADASWVDNGNETIARLHGAGLPVLAGTDARNPGVVHGASLHGELEMLVDAGVEPVAALAASTSVPADTFGLVDRGRIQAGRRADLLLVEGDPTQDITATRGITHVWRDGHPIDREAILNQLDP